MILEGRKKIFILVSIFVLFLLAFLLVYFVLRKPAPSPLVPETVVTPTSTVQTPPPSVVPVKNTPAPPPQTTAEREQLYVKQLARTFVERLETYSNQNKNRNIVDATELATPNMAGYIATKSLEQGTEYQGATTKVISMEVTSFSFESATVKIGAQVETQSKNSSAISYKNGRVELKKIDGTWKVDGVFWENTTP